MKRIILCLLIMIFSIGILNVDAVTIKPTGNSTALAGSDIDVYITLTRTSSEKQISAIEGKLNVDANVLTLKSAEVLLGNSWTEFSPIKANGTFAYGNLNYNSLISDTSKNLFKLTFTVKSGATGSTTISTSNTTGNDETGDTVSITGGSLAINIGANSNTSTSEDDTNNTATGDNTADIDYSENTNTNTTEEKANPETGYFIPTLLIIVGSVGGIIIYVSRRKKHFEWN